MVEVEEYLQASVQVIDGVKMVTLEVALTALRTVNATLTLEAINQTVAELYETLSDAQIGDEQEV